MKKKVPLTFYWFIILVTSLCIIIGCKDEETKDTIVQEEKCLTLLNKKFWADAISVCSAIGTDIGFRYAADAYLGRAGLDLISLTGLLDSDTGDKSAKLGTILPSTTAEVNDYTSAVDLLGSKVSTLSDNDHMRIVISTTLLIYHYMLDTFGLDLSEETSNIEAIATICSADPCAKFTTFFENTCNSDYEASDNDGNCSIKEGSLLYYNGSSSSALATLGLFSQFNLKTKMDNGEDPTVSDLIFGDCTPDTADDDIITECELVYYIANPSF